MSEDMPGVNSIIILFNEMMVRFIKAGSDFDYVVKQFKEVVSYAESLVDKCDRYGIANTFVGSEEKVICAWARLIYQSGKVDDSIFPCVMKMIVSLYATANMLQYLINDMVKTAKKKNNEE